MYLEAIIFISLITSSILIQSFDEKNIFRYGISSSTRLLYSLIDCFFYTDVIIKISFKMHGFFKLCPACTKKVLRLTSRGQCKSSGRWDLGGRICSDSQCWKWKPIKTGAMH